MLSKLDAMKREVSKQKHRLEELEKKLSRLSHRTYEDKYGPFSCENFYPLRKKENGFANRLRNSIFSAHCERHEEHIQTFQHRMM